MRTKTGISYEICDKRILEKVVVFRSIDASKEWTQNSYKGFQMRTKKRRAIGFLFLLVGFLVLLFGGSVPHQIVSAESLYVRKIVSVVYDDSGSMDGDKWAYANYAMQSFCGMLNSEDQLYITYMSHSQQIPDYQPEKIDLSEDEIQASVDSIRAHTSSGSTPLKAMELAYEKLKTVEDSNPNTQYWLVVITDGSFDEWSGRKDKPELLNAKFREYTDAVMPNGSKPQITFMSIGSVIAPDEDPSRNIYTYYAQSAFDVVSTMSEMADKISGRTRLDQSSVQVIDGNTLRVSSSIPLLNIVVFSQGCDAKLTKCTYGANASGTGIPLTRSVALSYPEYGDLIGGAFQVSDSQSTIDAGTYTLVFDQTVDPDDVIILFEPALEVRMTISVNGKEISSPSDLRDTMEGDQLSLSCKIYEMGTDHEIGAELLPNDTQFEVSVSENGSVVKQELGQNMSLVDYSLKNTFTKITATVRIKGYNPIEYSVSFTPTVYVPRIHYEIVPSFVGDKTSVEYEEIASNRDFSVCFTVYADGVEMTDPNAVKALAPDVIASPSGNAGIVSYTADGKIVFTPNMASEPNVGDREFSVKVTCTIEDGTTASETYTVVLPDFQVVAVASDPTVRKTAFYENTVGVSFYVTKDGERLSGQELDSCVSALLSEEYASLQTKVSVSDDGTVTVVPYSNEERKLNVWTWWGNWLYYFKLPSDDMTVTLEYVDGYAVGSASATMNVVQETLAYQILNVFLPLAIEIAAIIFLIDWIVVVVKKPKYQKDACLYIGNLYLRSGEQYIQGFKRYSLARYNHVKYGRLKFKKKADVQRINGIAFRATHGGMLVCENRKDSEWYYNREGIRLEDSINSASPDDLVDRCKRNTKVKVSSYSLIVLEKNGDKFSFGDKVEMKSDRYFVIPDMNSKNRMVDDEKQAVSGKIFIYYKKAGKANNSRKK